jgi:hypothetical protein
LVGKPEGKRPFGKFRRRWEGNRLEGNRVGGYGLDLAQDSDQ